MDKYSGVKLICVSSYGKVYSDQKVVLKIFEDHREYYFKHERNILKMVSDIPGCQQYLDDFVHEDTYVLVSKYTGLDLYEAQTIDVVELYQSMIDTLEKLHARDITHLDVKPENITYDGSFTLIDFGLSNVKGGTKMYKYTKGYSPRDRSNLKYNDHYGLAVTLYELCHNRREPFFNNEYRGWTNGPEEIREYVENVFNDPTYTPSPKVDRY